MKLNNKIILSFLLALGLSYFFLFAFGNLGQIVAYKDLGTLPQLKLTLLQILIFAIMTLSNFYILRNFIPRRKHTAKTLFFIGIIDLVVVYHLPSMGTYIGMGDVLRDTHGINWYHMDFGGWAITLVVFSLSIIGSILLFLANTIFKRGPRK